MDRVEAIPLSSPPSQTPKTTSPGVALSSPTAVATKAREEASRSIRLRTGWPRLQRLCPPRSGRIWLLGGAPGSHKTSWALTMALDMALAKQRVLFATLELTSGEIGMRALSRFAGVAMDRIDRSFGPERMELTDAENERIADAEARLGDLEMFLRFHGADAHGFSLREVMASATKARFDAVFVDHLGIVDRGTGNELDAIPRAADAFRRLARGAVVKGYTPFVCVTTPLSRRRDEDDHPKLSHLRGSGNLEYDADGVVVLQKRERQGEDGGLDEIDGFVLKNRQGPAPLVLSFEADGSMAVVREKAPAVQDQPRHWQEDA